MIGLHVHKHTRKTLTKAIDKDSEKYELECVQIFTHNPRTGSAIKMNYEDVLKKCEELDLPLVVHSAYITTGVLKLENKEELEQTKGKKKLNLLKRQLEACVELEALGLVVHLPKAPLSTIVKAMTLIEPTRKKTGCKILLENMWYKPDGKNTFQTPQRLSKLCEHLSKAKISKDGWGICLDSAHMWAGMTFDNIKDSYDVRTFNGMKKWLKDFKYRKKIDLIHFNGSYTPITYHKDQHCIPMLYKEDLLWGIEKKPDYKKLGKKKLKSLLPYTEKMGLRYLIKFAKKYDIPMTLEVNRGTDEEIKWSIALLKLIRDEI